ncbi:MAG: hypothetical protein MUE46_04025 [Xanthomonadales bacterium]|jgi:hypothetical protein|nr:hypothetical protein [Xanthomonadales bacterium]
MSDLILTDATRTALWHDLIRDAEHRARRPLAEDVQSYLVFTLMRLTSDAALGARILALDFLQSLGVHGQRRADELRDVGDRCLLLAGLYPEQAERRAVPLSYFCALGSSAYEALADGIRNSVRELYVRLAHSFRALVRVLIEVRKLSGEWRGLRPLDQLSLCAERDHVDHAEAQRAFPGMIVVGGSGRA